MIIKHIMPENDSIEHQASYECPCAPTSMHAAYNDYDHLTERIWVHNAQDGRGLGDERRALG